MSSNIFLLILILMPLIGSILGYWLGTIKESYRNALHMAVYIAGFIIVSYLYVPVSRETISIYIPDLLGTGLLLKLDMLRYIFLWLTALIWPLAMLFSNKYLIRDRNRNRYYLFFLLTYLSALGVFLSENILNLFTFFELMSLASYFLITQNDDVHARNAGASYLAVTIAGGMFLLLGILLAYNYAETLVISNMDILYAAQNTRIAIGILILIGFGIKACAYPLHFWMPKTYTASPMPTTIVLSAVLAKTGIFGILVTLHYMLRGEPILESTIAVLGMITIIWGGIMALFQRNMKRILAYSSMSQMGYILLAVALMDILGDNGQNAVLGALAHVLNHGLIKTLLFIIVGVLYVASSEYSINEIMGIGRHFRSLKWVFLLGALNLMGFPGSAGYVSKTIIHEALLEALEILPESIYYVFDGFYYLGGALTIAYTLKLFNALFVEKENRHKFVYKAHFRKWQIHFPIIVLSTLLIAIGTRPELLEKTLISAASIVNGGGYFTVHLFTAKSLLSSLKTFILGITLYIAIVHLYLRKKNDGEVWYINPLSDILRLEEDIVFPLFSRIFKYSLAIFTTLDKSLTYLVVFVYKIVRRALVVLDPDLRRVKREEKKNKLDCKIQEFKEKESKHENKITEENISQYIYETSKKQSTMSNAVFIFGAIFILSLLFIFLRSTILRY